MSSLAKQVLTGDPAAWKLLSGMRLLAETVGVTLGPGGRQVVLEHRSGLAPRMSKDGVGIARELAIADKEAEMGLRLLRQAAIAVSEDSGDGTTTAILLAYELASRCLAGTTSGIDPIAIRDALAISASKVMQELEALAAPANRADLKQVAKIAGNGEEAIAELLIAAFDEVGVDGIIEVEMGSACEDILEVKVGAVYETRSLVSELHPPVGTLELKRPLVLLYDRQLTSFEELVPALEFAVAEKRPLLILADDLEEEVRLGLIANQRKKLIQVAVIKPPMYGDTRLDAMMDLALLCGGRAILARDLRSLASITREDLGGADHVSLSSVAVNFTGGHGDKANIRNQVAILRGDLLTGDTDSDSPSGRRDYLGKRTERLKMLLDSTAVIHVGGSTDLEIKSRLPLVENARRAMLAAAETGVLPGGGVAFLRVAEKIGEPANMSYDSLIGVGAFCKSLAEPLHRIVKNAGYRPEEVLTKILANENQWFGFDANKGNYCDLRHAGVIDSLRVTQHVVHVAVSVAGSLLSAGALISELNTRGKFELPNGVSTVHRKLLAEGAFDS